MGWLAFALLGAATLALLARAARADGALLRLFGAALVVAAAGYAWQGRPSLAGHPGAPGERGASTNGLFALERRAWLERMGPDAQVLDTADAFAGRGDADYAIGILRGAIGRRPASAMLWTGLGNALTRYADGQVTPAARYAFAHAAALAPRDPAPDYFLGLALAESGDAAGAIAAWRHVLARPLDPVRRGMILVRIAALERLGG